MRGLLDFWFWCVGNLGGWVSGGLVCIYDCVVELVSGVGLDGLAVFGVLDGVLRFAGVWRGVVGCCCAGLDLVGLGVWVVLVDYCLVCIVGFGRVWFWASVLRKGL